MGAAFLALETANFIRIDSASHSVSDTLRPFIIESAALGVVLWAVYSLITGGRRAG